MNKLFHTTVSLLLVAATLMPASSQAQALVERSRGSDVRSEANRGSRNALPKLVTELTARPSNHRGNGVVHFPTTTYIKKPLSLRDQYQKGAIAPGTPNIIGSIIYGGEEPPVGIYSIASSSCKSIKLSDNLNASYGGTYSNGKYFCSYIYQGTYYTIMYNVLYDAETWEPITIRSAAPMNTLATAIANDPTTNTVYGCFYNYNGDGFEFGTIDINTFERTTISTIDLNSRWSSCSFTADGTLYAIAIDGGLYKINKSTGEPTKVGDTGLGIQYITSGAIDPKTNIYYYAVATDDEMAMYRVNIETGAATYYFEMPEQEEVAGMYIGTPFAADGAPASVSNIKATFTDGSLLGSVSFKAPTVTFDGNTGTGSIDYHVYANDVEVATGTTSYGEDVSAQVAVPEAGTYVIKVIASNSAGYGPSESISTWIGNDVPAKVTGITLTRDGDNFNLSWSKVTSAVHRGYIDADNVTYTIRRYPDDVEVASGLSVLTYVDNVPVPSNLTAYYYGVTAVFDGRSSAEGYSKRFYLGTIVPPYKETFDTAESLTSFTIIDNNADGKTWAYKDSKAYVPYNKNMAMDDYLITTKVSLKAGYLYEFSFDAQTARNTYHEQVAAYMGKEPTVEAMTTCLVETMDVKPYNPIPVSRMVSVEEDGDYYFAIHGCSKADMFYLYVDNLYISAPMLPTAPNVVENVSFLPDYNGANSTTVSFDTPTKDMSGNELTSITKVEVMRDGVTLGAIYNPKPGTRQSFIDNVGTAGTYTYRIVVYNESGIGKAVDEDNYVGLTYAGAAKNVVLTETETPGEVHLTWNQVNYDNDGNPLNPDLVTYSVYNPNSEIFYAMDLADCSATFTAVTGDTQAFTYYYIVSNVGGNANFSKCGVSNMIPVGKAYEMPFKESIAGKKAGYIWGAKGNGTWYYAASCSSPAATPYDEDGGMLMFTPDDEEDQSNLYSGKIAINNEPFPCLSFYYYGIEDAEDVLKPYIIYNGETRYLGSYTLGSAGKTGWSRLSFPLTEYAGKNIQIGFHVECVDWDNSILIDDICIENVADNDVKLSKLNAPEKVTLGKEFTITATVDNVGNNPAGEFTVDLFKGAEKIATKSVAELASMTSTEVSFPIATSVFETEGNVEYSAVVNYAADEAISNNTSGIVSVAYELPTYPAVEDLTGKIEDGKSILTWTEPQIQEQGAVTESFEDYTSFEINNAGDWKFIDGDGAVTYGLSYGTFPNMQSAMAYIVFDSTYEGLGSYSSSFAAKTGNKCMASFAAIEVTSNDDWMISPLLSGDAQTISFYAKSYTVQYGNETFEVLYSTTGTEKEDFTSLTTVSDTPATWNLYEAELPVGAKYFAIRCTSPDRFIFMVDDVTYIPAKEEIELLGYNVYQDGVKLNTEVITATNATYDNDGQLHNYVVTVVYDKGESKISNVVTLDPTGVGRTVGNGISVYGKQGVITINGALGERITVYSADGKLVYRGVGKDVTKVEVEAGVYLVEIANRVVKIML